MVAEASRRAKHKGFTKQFAGATLPSIMNVQCSAERLSTASRFDTYQERPIFTRFQRRLSEVLDPRYASTEGHAGRLAVNAISSEPEELPGSYSPIDESSMMGLVDGPGGTVTAYSFDLGPGETLL